MQDKAGVDQKALALATRSAPDAADKDLAVLEQRIQEKLKPYEAQLTLLDEIPGVDWKGGGSDHLVELGVDLYVFQNVLQSRPLGRSKSWQPWKRPASARAVASLRAMCI